MKLKSMLVWGVTGLLLSVGIQAATISKVEGLELLAVDGKAVEKRHAFDDVKSVDVNAGTHQVVFRYYNGVNRGGKNVIYSTSPYVFTIDLKQNDSIKIITPHLTAYSQAMAYFHRHVDWKVRYADGREVSTNAVKLHGNGIAPFSDIEKAVATYNLEEGNQFAPESVQPQIANQKLQKADDTLVQTVQMLFNNATPAQKVKIKQWMANQ